MAKLHSDITVSAELRPCITTAHGNRCKGLFHKWLTESFGNMSTVVGIAVSKYKYTLNFNPDMWVPFEAERTD